MSPFSFPTPVGAQHIPVWTGRGFQVGDATVPVLEYSENFEGWSDDLTTLHEEAAGELHPIDVASRRDALDQLKRHLAPGSTPVILEVGCSSGFLVRAALRAFPDAFVMGADVVREPLFALARELPTVPLLRFDLGRCPLAADSCDAVVLLNVLEHIEHDTVALGHVYRILRPGGIAVIEVPAGPELFDAYDRALRHFRRYRLKDLVCKLEAAGFHVERKTHLGFLAYPAFAFAKRANQLRAQALEDPHRVVKEQVSRSSSSRLLSTAMVAEHFLGRWLAYPYGIRCLTVGRKP